MSSKRDLYAILGVSPECQDVVIHAAYRGMMRLYHPDTSKDPDAASKAQEINAAYATLGNGRKRAAYDASLEASLADRSPVEVPVVETKQPPVPPQIVEAEEPDSNRKNSAFLKLALAALAAFFLYLASGISGNGAVTDRLNENIASDSALKIVNATSPVKVAAAPKPASINLDDAVTFDEPANCVAAPQLDKAYKDLLPFDENGGVSQPKPVVLGTAQLRPELIDFTRADDPAGTIRKLSSVRFPTGATWHGLRVARLISAYIAPPDTDSSYSRSITFRATQDEVRAVLANLNFNPPNTGGSSSLTDQACGGQMEIVGIPGGTELKCSWGC